MGVGGMTIPAPLTALALHDKRPFFESALAYGVQHGIIDAQKLAAINADAPKGMVQIARYFGSEFLRPELEKARERMVNLISLYLLESTGGDLHAAAQSLREHSFLSRSKGGSDMLKRLIALPESSHFGMAGYDAAQTPLLALWSLRSHADYRAELARRSQIAQAIDAALWLAAHYDLEAEDLEEAGADAEAVIRTALLWRALAPRASDWPQPVSFEKALTAQRKKKSALAQMIAPPTDLPQALHAVVQAQCATVQAECAKLLEAAPPKVRAMLRPLSAFRGRYLLLEDPLAEIDDLHRSAAVVAGEDEGDVLPASKAWGKATQGNEDEHALLTLFVTLAAGGTGKTLLTEKSATALVRKIRKHGWQPERASDFITANAASALQADYQALWRSFVSESQATLCSDHDHTLQDAVAVLRRECHVVDH